MREKERERIRDKEGQIEKERENGRKRVRDKDKQCVLLCMFLFQLSDNYNFVDSCNSKQKIFRIFRTLNYNLIVIYRLTFVFHFVAFVVVSF